MGKYSKDISCRSDIGVEWLGVWLEEESRGRQTVPKLVKPVMPGDLS